jgi:hypothetical protein
MKNGERNQENLPIEASPCKYIRKFGIAWDYTEKPKDVFINALTFDDNRIYPYSCHDIMYPERHYANFRKVKEYAGQIEFTDEKIQEIMAHDESGKSLDRIYALINRVNYNLVYFNKEKVDFILNDNRKRLIHNLTNLKSEENRAELYLTNILMRMI